MVLVAIVLLGAAGGAYYWYRITHPAEAPHSLALQGNIDPNLLGKVLQQGLTSAGRYLAVRTWLDDPLVESAIGLVAPYFVYWLAEEAHGSGVIAVVVVAGNSTRFI